MRPARGLLIRANRTGTGAKAFMGYFDFILNLAALLLWLNWRSLRFDPLAITSAASLAGTLKRAQSTRWRGWHFLLALLAVLAVRPLLYTQIGPALDWTPVIELGPISIPFRSDYLSRMFLFSGLSFLRVMAVFYLCLLLLSIINGSVVEPDLVQRLVRLHLRPADRWPWWVKWSLPIILIVPSWFLLSLLLERMGLLPAVSSLRHRLEEGAVIALGAYLVWKYVAGPILALRVLHTYVYLGNNPFWGFIDQTSARMLGVLPWVASSLRFGRIDFAPIAAIALIFLVAEFARQGLTMLYSHLPL